ncbi:hypothetical protein FVEN_g3908 [Fusarium venenatum]|nr:hypothetical protein FVEN_g3908 [Fusarium venenatum]
MLLEARATVRYYHKPILHIFSHHIKGRDAADKILQDLLMHGANLEEKDVSDFTPAMAAVNSKNILALRILISVGASLTAINSEDNNNLHIAAVCPDVEMINYIGKQDLSAVEVEQRNTFNSNTLYMPYAAFSRPSWRIRNHFPRQSVEEIEAFTTFYFDLLIPELRRQTSTIGSLIRVVKHRDVTVATKILNQLIERNVRCNQTDLVSWYRGLKGYVIDGGWDYLQDVLKDEYEDTNEKIGQAAIARGNAITDPEMVEFF